MEGTELSKYNSFCLKQLTVMCKLDTMKSYNRLKNIEQIVFFFYGTLIYLLLWYLAGNFHINFIMAV